jgi:hypothetical protein
MVAATKGGGHKRIVELDVDIGADAMDYKYVIRRPLSLYHLQTRLYTSPMITYQY